MKIIIFIKHFGDTKTTSANKIDLGEVKTEKFTKTYALPISEWVIH
jgi:hypothetical protein